MILAHVFGDRLIILALDRLIYYVQYNKSITSQAKDQIIHITTTIKSLVPLLQSLNRVLFYWDGSFYTWAKRFFFIKYVSKGLNFKLKMTSQFDVSVVQVCNIANLRSADPV